MATIPTENDVLFGRGNNIKNYPGNRRFRALVEAKRDRFQRAPKRKEKRAIARELIDKIYSLKPPGRFMESEVKSSAISERVWVVASDSKVMKKVLHRLREKEWIPGNSNSNNYKKSNKSDLNAEGIPNNELPTNHRSQEDETSESGNGSDLDDWNSFFQKHIDVNHLKVFGRESQRTSNTDSSDEPSMDDLDDELDLFWSGFGDEHEETASQIQLTLGENERELTMRQWITETSYAIQADTKTKTTGKALEYAQSALPVALKLTEYLTTIQKSEDKGVQNEVPLESIVIENAFIRMKNSNTLESSSQRNYEVLSVQITVTAGVVDNPETGEVSQRLASLGAVLYELFSGEPPVVLPCSTNSFSLSTINLDADSASNDRPQKKSNRQSPYSNSESIAKLASIGIPHSLCFLLGNLLDCYHGDFCGDEAYRSLADVKVDLQLMLDNPERFLYDIKTSPLPALDIRDEVFGREDEIKSLEHSYRQHIDGKCNGGTIRGGAGTGKSRVAMTVECLTSNRNGYFLVAKFDQNKDVKPLSTIGNAFNALCDLYVRDATSSELKTVEKELAGSLGNQAGLLAGVVPSLGKLMPSCNLHNTWSSCANSALSMRFLLSELLRVLASHLRSITIVLDDIQWADFASLLLAGDLASNKSVFFIFCFRDDEVDASVQFTSWLSSFSLLSLDEMKLEGLDVDGVNRLVSDALHLVPSVTRPLSTVLHHKTRGLPFFVRRLVYSLEQQNFIRVQMEPPRWTWDLERIADLEISEDVLALLVKEMKSLPSDHQLGLQLAACIGTGITKHELDILSRYLGKNLYVILSQVSTKGYMKNDNGSIFSFVHDKIEQACYESMSIEERRGNHMRYGLALCENSMENGGGDYELFFAALNQINRGGPSAVDGSNQKDVIADLNLRGGIRSIELSDMNTAFKLFISGISFLDMNHWESQYDLSIGLFDAAAEAACVLNKSTEVASLCEQVVRNARCYDDQLHCLYTGVKALRQAELHREAMSSMFEILTHLEEEELRPIQNNIVRSKIHQTNELFQRRSDRDILDMKITHNKKIITLLKIYELLGPSLHFTMPGLLAAMSLRMIEITMENGLTPIAPTAFALYGEVLAGDGNLVDACRFGRLALKLLEKEALSMHKAAVILMVYSPILWAAEPLQSVVEAHQLGQKVGHQRGDWLYAGYNWHMSITTSFFAGQDLNLVRRNAKSFISVISKQKGHVDNMILIYWQTVALSEGLHTLDEEQNDEEFPCESDVLLIGKGKNVPVFVILNKVLMLIRKYLFHQLEDDVVDINISSRIAESNETLRATTLLGIFFEGLACFKLARQSLGNKRVALLEQGESVLARMRFYNDHSTWNFENKMLLLEAERMYTLDNFDQADSFYQQSILSAHKHKFIHEEAIASYLLGEFLHEQRLFKKSKSLLLHSIQCFEKWGAFAVARRVETIIQSKFSSDWNTFGTYSDVFTFDLTPDAVSSKKRQNWD
mmetsp:Transcript_43738/g.91966  ORF Transcript_43738/g.91966 Transcript_43738/m.91966 type:complete len:1476 (+) Transcript_43738:19-4446(+)